MLCYQAQCLQSQSVSHSFSFIFIFSLSPPPTPSCLGHAISAQSVLSHPPKKCSLKQVSQSSKVGQFVKLPERWYFFFLKEFLGGGGRCLQEAWVSEVLDPLKLELHVTCSCERTYIGNGKWTWILHKGSASFSHWIFSLAPKNNIYVIFYMVTGKAVLKNKYTDQCNGSAGKELDTQAWYPNLMYTSHRTHSTKSFHDFHIDTHASNYRDHTHNKFL